MSAKHRRQECIRELLARNQVHSQEQLLALLRAESVDTTQATLSRDLRELGVAKHAEGYELPDSAAPRSEIKALDRALRDSLVSARRAGNLVVLHTHPGLGQSLSLRLDQARLPQAVGTISDGETLFIATSSWNQAEALLRRLRRAARI